MQQNTVFSGEYSRRDIFLVMTLVYIFGVICRYYWVVWTLGMDEFWLNGVPLLTTNDAFANAEGARDMLAGFHQKGDLSPYGASIPTLTFLISNILSSNVDCCILFEYIFISFASGARHLNIKRIQNAKRRRRGVFVSRFGAWVLYQDYGRIF